MATAQNPYEAARSSAASAIDDLIERLGQVKAQLAERVANAVQAACQDQDDTNPEAICVRVHHNDDLTDTDLSEALDDVLTDAATAWSSFGRTGPDEQGAYR